MIKANQRFLNFINILLDALFIFVSFILAFYIRFYLLDGQIGVPFWRYIKMATMFTPAQLLIFYFLHMYAPQRKERLHREVARMVVCTLIGFVLLMTILYFVKSVEYSRVALVFLLVMENFLMGAKRVGLRLFLRKMRSRGYNQKHIIIVGSNSMARRCYDEIRRSPELGYSVHGYVSDSDEWKDIPYLGTIDQLEKLMETDVPDEVLAALDGEEHRYLAHIVDVCETNGVRFSFVPYYSQFMTGRTQIDSLNGIPVLNLRKIPLDHVGNAFIKRAVDIVGSLVLIILTSPLMIFAAIGVKLSSPGPILFKQERIGYEKKPFYMYKFRSMRVNAAQNTGWTTDTDPRKTKFGSFIRKYSIDELPQFFNVLIGDMSLIGPRPEIPYYVAQFKDDIPQYLVRQQVRPGITGWAQVNGLRGDTSIEERARYDRWYIENWSLGLDFVILLKTVFGGFMNSEKISK